MLSACKLRNTKVKSKQQLWKQLHLVNTRWKKKKIQKNKYCGLLQKEHIIVTSERRKYILYKDLNQQIKEGVSAGDTLWFNFDQS